MTPTIKRFLHTLCLVAIPGMTLAFVALAADEAKAFQSPLKAESVAQVLGIFFGYLVQLGAVAVTLAIIYSGFLFVVAQGKPEELQKAKKTLFWTIIGALVLLGSQLIAGVIQKTITTIGS